MLTEIKGVFSQNGEIGLSKGKLNILWGVDGFPLSGSKGLSDPNAYQKRGTVHITPASRSWKRYWNSRSRLGHHQARKR